MKLGILKHSWYCATVERETRFSAFHQLHDIGQAFRQSQMTRTITALCKAHADWSGDLCLVGTLRFLQRTAGESALYVALLSQRSIQDETAMY